MKWHTARHRVTLIGRVVEEESGKPVAGATVAIVHMPDAFQRALELFSLRFGKRWDAMPDRPDRTRSRDDGCFFFMDLPAGKYTINVSLPGAGRRYRPTFGTAQVSRDVKGHIQLTPVQLGVRPTSLKGRISGVGQKNPIVLADVRVKGSGERAFSDTQGKYSLSAIEPGRRTVLVFANGYQPASQVVKLEAPGDAGVADFTLVPEKQANHKPRS